VEVVLNHAEEAAVPPIQLPVNPELLSQIMRPPVAAGRLWAPDELQDVLRHQLDARLSFDLAHSDPARAALIDRQAAAVCPPIATFGDLLRHPRPPVELLQWVKAFAKAGRSDPNGPLPAEIGAFLYYACIASALVHHGLRITTLPDAAICDGLRSLLGQGWLDAGSRGLFSAAMQNLCPGRIDGVNEPLNR